MKSIGLSDGVYIELLDVKHSFEKQEGRVISYDEIIKKLIYKNNGNNNQQKRERGKRIILVVILLDNNHQQTITLNTQKTLKKIEEEQWKKNTLFHITPCSQFAEGQMICLPAYIQAPSAILPNVATTKLRVNIPQSVMPPNNTANATNISPATNACAFSTTSVHLLSLLHEKVSLKNKSLKDASNNYQKRIASRLLSKLDILPLLSSLTVPSEFEKAFSNAHPNLPIQPMYLPKGFFKFSKFLDICMQQLFNKITVFIKKFTWGIRSLIFLAFSLNSYSKNRTVPLPFKQLREVAS